MTYFDQEPPMRPPGGRNLPRPSTVAACGGCSAPLGRNYRGCPVCMEAVEQLWQADWRQRLGEQGIAPGSAEETRLAQDIADNLDGHTWTDADTAMSLLRCKDCGQELCGGPLACAHCQNSFSNLFAYDVEALFQGTMTDNEHALRVGRWVLRHPHRHKPGIAEAWKVSVPLLLTGKLPTPEQAAFIKKMIDAGRFDFSARCYNSFEEACKDALAHRS